MISRLLFAVARGARLEVFSEGAWRESHWLYIMPGLARRRIHPGDTHLQYGPLSANLRHRACNPDTYFDSPAIAGIELGALDLEAPNDFCKASASAKSFYRLFFAEYLADEGL